MNVCCFSGVGSTWIDHHDFEAAGIALFSFEQTLEQHRMAFGRVGADEESHLAVIEVVVAAGRAVRSEALGVPSNG